MKRLLTAGLFAAALLILAPGTASAQSGTCREAGVNCDADRTAQYNAIDAAYAGCVPVEGYIVCLSMWSVAAGFIEAMYYSCVGLPPCMIGGERFDPVDRPRRGTLA